MFSSTHIPALALAAVMLLGACASDVGEGWVELGTGEWRFEPVDGEQEVPLVAGVQGGWHVWASVRTGGLAPERVAFEIETEPVDGSMPPERSRVALNLRLDEESQSYDFLGWPAVLSRPGCVMGRPMVVRVRLTDSRGVTAEDERIVTPMPDGSFTPPPCE